MTCLVTVAGIAIAVAACGLVKIKVLDPIAENRQDLEDLTVLISDMSGKEE